MLDPQRGDAGVPVVARLRLPALVGRDDEADHGRRPDSGKHVAEEAFVAGDVHEGDLLPGRH